MIYVNHDGMYDPVDFEVDSFGSLSELLKAVAVELGIPISSIEFIDAETGDDADADGYPDCDEPDTIVIYTR
jgi:hypothetical protein